jgi:hypothetical protein
MERAVRLHRSDRKCRTKSNPATSRVAKAIQCINMSCRQSASAYRPLGSPKGLSQGYAVATLLNKICSIYSPPWCTIMRWIPWEGGDVTVQEGIVPRRPKHNQGVPVFQAQLNFVSCSFQAGTCLKNRINGAASCCLETGLDCGKSTN